MVTVWPPSSISRVVALSSGALCDYGGLRTAAGIAVGTGDGLLELLELQAEGSRAMPSREFLRGRPDFFGETLPS